MWCHLISIWIIFLSILKLKTQLPWNIRSYFFGGKKSSHSRTLSEDIAKDIFSVGCLLAELHLQRPLFDSTSLTMYLESGVFPGVLQELPPQTKILVEACIEKDWTRTPSAKSLLESPHFPKTVKSSYLFISPFQLIAKDGSHLCYAANFAKQGALKAMGSFATEMCVPYCLPLVVTPLSDAEAEWAYILLKEFIKFFTLKAVETMSLPAIQKILQAISDNRLFTSEGFSSSRLICARDMEDQTKSLMFCSLMCFNYLGMLLESLTPNIQLASILTPSAYTMLNLFFVFIVSLATAVLIIFPILLSSLFACFIGKLNYQRR
ncbi:hypothetical protein Pint_24247 [Pistacia integerrima]|uniref:Uncharacterized protein n=1 Tax=Pistacia integerrima TaxID=434235 RepID=A0ACC0YFZ4_9ROSI|nr:hypothetical protein Pint_24247 [Pistacia integerrima]